MIASELLVTKNDFSRNIEHRDEAARGSSAFSRFQSYNDFVVSAWNELERGVAFGRISQWSDFHLFQIHHVAVCRDEKIATSEKTFCLDFVWKFLKNKA